MSKSTVHRPVIFVMGWVSPERARAGLCPSLRLAGFQGYTYHRALRCLMVLPLTASGRPMGYTAALNRSTALSRTTVVDCMVGNVMTRGEMLEFGSMLARGDRDCNEKPTAAADGNLIFGKMLAAAARTCNGKPGPTGQWVDISGGGGAQIILVGKIMDS